jgi:hypothetical protein
MSLIFTEEKSVIIRNIRGEVLNGRKKLIARKRANKTGPISAGDEAGVYPAQ